MTSYECVDVSDSQQRISRFLKISVIGYHTFAAPRIDNPEPLNLLPQPSFLNPADLAQSSTRMLHFISLLELRTTSPGHFGHPEQTQHAESNCQLRSLIPSLTPLRIDPLLKVHGLENFAGVPGLCISTRLAGFVGLFLVSI